MKKKTLFIFLIGLFVFSSLALVAFAAEQPNAVDSILGPFGGRFVQVYTKYFVFIDAAIYLIIFLGLTQISLKRLWQGRDKKAMKTMMIGISLVLALSLALFEAQQGFNISSFGPLAAIILMALLGYTLWGGLKELDVGDPMKRAAGAYIVVYYSMIAVVPSAMNWINENVPIVAAILALLGAVFTIYILLAIIMWIASLFGKADTDKAVKEIKDKAEEEVKKKTEPAPTTETEKKKKDAEEEAKKKKDKEEKEKKARNITELNAAEGFLIRASTDMKKLMDSAPAAFKAAVEHWGDEWKTNPDIPSAQANAMNALKVLKTTIGDPYMNAIANFQNGIKEVISAVNIKKYEDVKKDLEKIRVEGEAQIDASGPLHELIEMMNYYGKILNKYLAGGYKMPPSSLQNTILKVSQNHIDKKFPKSMKHAYNAINVVLEKVKKLIEKIKK